MREIVPMDEYGMFVDNHDIAKVNSVMVAKMFEKRHDDVLRSIRNLDCSEEFRLRNFAESSYRNEQGKKQPCFNMTRDGFVFLRWVTEEKKLHNSKKRILNASIRWRSLSKHLRKRDNNFRFLLSRLKCCMKIQDPTISVTNAIC